jgi:hypothetical protein
MTEIPVALLEFQEGGRALWIHDHRGCTVLRVHCTGKVNVHNGCTNICAHADINVTGDIDVCIPPEQPTSAPVKTVRTIAEEMEEYRNMPPATKALILKLVNAIIDSGAPVAIQC